MKYYITEFGYVVNERPKGVSFAEISSNVLYKLLDENKMPYMVGGRVVFSDEPYLIKPYEVKEYYQTGKNKGKYKGIKVDEQLKKNYEAEELNSDIYKTRNDIEFPKLKDAVMGYITNNPNAKALEQFVAIESYWNSHKEKYGYGKMIIDLKTEEGIEAMPEAAQVIIALIQSGEISGLTPLPTNENA